MVPKIWQPDKNLYEIDLLNKFQESGINLILLILWSHFEENDFQYTYIDLKWLATF